VRAIAALLLLLPGCVPQVDAFCVVHCGPRAEPELYEAAQQFSFDLFDKTGELMTVERGTCGDEFCWGVGVGDLRAASDPVVWLDGSVVRVEDPTDRPLAAVTAGFVFAWTGLRDHYELDAEAVAAFCAHNECN
jgi:hypothetical protein